MPFSAVANCAKVNRIVIMVIAASLLFGFVCAGCHGDGYLLTEGKPGVPQGYATRIVFKNALTSP